VLVFDKRRVEQMLEDVEASAFADRCRQKKQRKKKRGRLLYSTLKQLERSRMRRSNVLPRFSADHCESSRTLDFENTDIEDSSCKDNCMQPVLEGEVEAMGRNDADVDKDCHDQVSANNQLAFLVNSMLPMF
jgi:hypothetical protein